MSRTAALFGAALPAFACAMAAVSAATSTSDLSGPMRAYAWFPGRWACRTTADATAAEPRPAKLWVSVLPNDAIREQFQMQLPSGKTYRADDTLRYDSGAHRYERRSIDINGTQIVLAAKTPFAATMQYFGVVGLRNEKLYRMRATIGVDAARDELTTATAFWDPHAHGWAVASTVGCTKISG